MTRRRNSLDSLWQRYLAQPSKISPETMAYVAALKARIDVLELDLALARGEVKRLAILAGDEAFRKDPS